jgi:hypothetical protein
MFVEMPPQLPAELVQPAQLQIQEDQKGLSRLINGVEVRVYAQGYLPDESVERVLQAAKLPSDALNTINALLVQSGDFSTRLIYSRVGNTVVAMVVTPRVNL